MDLLRLLPPRWWAPGLTEEVEQVMAAEAARVEDIRRSQDARIRKARRTPPATEEANAAALVRVHRKITDLFDPEVNTFPDWWPPRLQALHKLWLRQVLPYFNKDKSALAAAIAHYNRQEHIDGSVFLLEGIVVLPGVPEFPVDAFRQLAHNIEAHEIGTANGAEAGRTALLSDEEAARRRWRQRFEAQKARAREIRQAAPFRALLKMALALALPLGLEKLAETFPFLRKQEPSLSKMGRHASPEREEEDRYNEQLVQEAVELARSGFPTLSERKLCDAGYDILEEAGQVLRFTIPARESVRQIYRRAREKETPRNQELEFQLTCIKQIGREIAATERLRCEWENMLSGASTRRGKW